MKVDGLAVVLAIILLPIILVVTFYIHLQVDTIATENQYNTKLLTATYSAMSAFEMNTSNEDLSSVADSMRSIIEASNNVFLDTLATSLGMSNASRQLLQPYIPAVLYTLYDGYYIYAPTQVPVVAQKTTDEGNGLVKAEGYQFYGEMDKTTGTQIIPDEQIEGADNAVYGDILYEADETKSGGRKYTIHSENAKSKEEKDSYILKSYVQYSGRYVQGNKDVTINYTLDNYLNIVGTINDIYYTKTGYLIQKGLVQNAHIEGVNDSDIWDLNEEDAKNKILGLKKVADEETIIAAPNASVQINGRTITSDFGRVADALHAKYNVEIKTIKDAEVYLQKMYEEYDEGKNPATAGLLGAINEIEYEIQNCKAVAYYISSQIFSNWVYEYLGDLKYGSIQQIDSIGSYEFSSGVETSIYYEFKDTDDRKIFDESEDPEDEKSKFYIHKLEVIKNSIKYNLNLAISAYTNTMNTSYNFSLPVLEEEEWDKILSNVSIVSFMQGWNCGLNIYNNYQMVCSTNNELTVTPSEIYYVESDKFNDTKSDYHRIDCPVWHATSDKFMSFKSKEVKFDKVLKPASTEYSYDHRNLACYTCINTGNYYERTLFLEKEETDYYKKVNSLKNTSGSDDTAKQTAAYIGIAKERIDTYKTNALPVSQGYKVFPQTGALLPDTVTTSKLNTTAPKAQVSKLLITISDTQHGPHTGMNETVGTFEIGVEDGSSNFSVSKNVILNAMGQKKEQTIEVVVPDNQRILKPIVTISKVAPVYSIMYRVQSIKVIYK